MCCWDGLTRAFSPIVQGDIVPSIINMQYNTKPSNPIKGWRIFQNKSFHIALLRIIVGCI